MTTTTKTTTCDWCDKQLSEYQIANGYIAMQNGIAFEVKITEGKHVCYECAFAAMKAYSDRNLSKPQAVS